MTRQKNSTVNLKNVHADKLIESGQSVIRDEASAVTDLIDKIDQHFAEACKIILDCKGRTVVLGMGKSGHIASKIAATLASTGTPAFFVHPGEASHGDLGMITSDDVIIALSNSGETDEIITLLPLMKRLGVPLISITGNNNSALALAATVNIDVSVKKEACPMGLAPTSSTTVSLAMGDAIAIALLDAREFTSDDFAKSHPGGTLGRRLLIHVEDIMHTGEEMPKVSKDSSLRDTLIEMTARGLGVTAVIDSNGKLLGVFTDGDLRRTMDKEKDLYDVTVGEVMTENCKSIMPDKLATEALSMMEEFKINAIPVVNKNNLLVGVINMHDLLRARIV